MMIKRPQSSDYRSDTEYKDAQIEYLFDQVVRLNLAVETLTVGAYPYIGTETLKQVSGYLNNLDDE